MGFCVGVVLVVLFVACCGWLVIVIVVFYLIWIAGLNLHFLGCFWGILIVMTLRWLLCVNAWWGLALKDWFLRLFVSVTRYWFGWWLCLVILRVFVCL